MLLLAELVDASARVAATRSRKAKVVVLADVLARCDPDEIGVVTHYLAGSLRQRRTGVGWRGARFEVEPSVHPTLTALATDATFEALAGVSGPGSKQRREDLLGDLLGQATADEQRYLVALIIGETRQGALDAVVLDAVGSAFGVPIELARRAAMFAGTTAAVAQAARSGGVAAVTAIGLSVGRPVQPMLASSAKSLAEALARFGAGPVAVDAKLDGVRIQAHRSPSGVRLFTRSLDEVTDRLPEVAAMVAGLPVETAILDGEVIALGPDGRPRPFQETASRSLSGDPDAAPVPLSVFFFDLLERDGVVLVDQPADARFAILDEVVPAASRVRRLLTDDPAAAAEFQAEVLAQGHEGVVVKGLAAPYDAGRRGASWVKVKPVHTLDLVVLAVERGSGRRSGYLSNIHLGARDPATGGFVMLGKTFKGMTDQMLAWQTERFERLAVSRDDWVVRLRPEQVVEVAFDGLQRSSRYPAGLALRFARVVRYRDDKTAEEADTIDTVRGLA